MKINFENDLLEFMKNVTIEDKEFSSYEDVKGNYFEMNTGALICRCDAFEIPKERPSKEVSSEYEVAVFSKAIEDLPYNTKTIKKATPKSEITGKEKDMNVLIEKAVEVALVYVVSNPYKVQKCFVDKNEALKTAKDINAKIKKICRS